MKEMMYACFIAFWLFITFVVPDLFTEEGQELPVFDWKNSAYVSMNPPSCRPKHMYLYSGLELVKVNLVNVEGKRYCNCFVE